MDIEPHDLQALEQEGQVLSRLKRFSQTLDDVDWYARLGEAPSAGVRKVAAAYLDALGFPDAELAILPTYEDAADVAETHDWASPAWEAEELLRADLTGRCLSLLSEDALEVALTMIADATTEAAKRAAEEQAALWDMADEAALNLAVGAAVQATHGAALALMAAGDGESTEEHPFALKYQLFELGRWPVAMIGESFSVF